MSNHAKGPNRELGKKGLTVNVKPVFSSDPVKLQENRARALENAIRNMKKLRMLEGMDRDIKRKEFYETKGQIRRRRKNEAIRRERKNRLKAEW